jgi:hypothetical protein
MPIDANATIRKKTTIPSKQKTTLKLILWTLTRVMDLETAKAKTIEMFKLGESIETIIEEVDNIEKSAEYAEMDTNLASLCVKPAKKSRAKKEAIAISGDADTIIKEMVEMATAEVKATPVKKSRVKKVAGETDVLVPVLDEETKTKPRTKAKDENVSTEASTEVNVEEPETNKTVKKSRTKAKAKDENVSTEALTEVNVEEPETNKTVKKPRTKAKAKAKTNESDENVSTEALTEVNVEEPETKPETKAKTKSRAKPKTKASTEDDNVEGEEPVKKSKAKAKTKASTEDDNVEKEEPVKKPRAKAATKAATKAEPQEETPITNDLAEEEYLVLNEVEYEGKQYMVGGDQNVYDEFNAVIGKYENGIITLNA